MTRAIIGRGVGMTRCIDGVDRPAISVLVREDRRGPNGAREARWAMGGWRTAWMDPDAAHQRRVTDIDAVAREVLVRAARGDSHLGAQVYRITD